MQAGRHLSSDARASVALRARAEELREELLEVQWRLGAITGHRPDPAQTVAQRIRTFLAQHAGKTFSPKELMEAIGGGEDAVRRALTHLVVDGLLVKETHANYKIIDPHHGPQDHDSAKVLRNWEDP